MRNLFSKILTFFSKLLLGWKVKKTKDVCVKRITHIEVMCNGGDEHDGKSTGVVELPGNAEK